MYERILVPLDGSKLAELALPCAEELAGVFNSEVVLIGICEPEESPYSHMCQLYIEKIAEVVGNRIKKVSSMVIVRPVALDGRPAEGIIDYTEKNNVSLIIMASHGRSGIMSWTLGSVANKVLQRTGTPILLIRAKASHLEAGAQGLFNRILVPLDGSDVGEVVLPHVRQLTEKLESEVVLLQVVAPGQHVHTIGGLDYVRFAEQQIESMKAEAKEYLQKVSKRLAGTKGMVRSEVRVGDTAHEIIKFADEANIRLVTISSHGRSGIRQWISGSVTHKILHAGNTPLLLVKALGVKA